MFKYLLKITLITQIVCLLVFIGAVMIFVGVDYLVLGLVYILNGLFNTGLSPTDPIFGLIQLYIIISLGWPIVLTIGLLVNNIFNYLMID